MNSTQRQLCVGLAAGLEALRAVSALGLALTATGLVLIALRWPAAGSAPAALAAASVLMLGLLERLWAARIAFDARLFAALANGQLTDLTALDECLSGLGLRPNTSPARDLGSRIAGTRGLVRQHLAIVIAQAACCGLIPLLFSLLAA